MNYPKPIMPSFKDQKNFIEFWSEFYSWSKTEELYEKNINKKQYSENDLGELYIWKNGMKLSPLKQKSFENKILAKLKIINNFKNKHNLDVEEFNVEFSNVSFVWKIFLLHIIKPKIYPIYDQNIHRAYLNLTDQDYSNITSDLTDKKKSKFYWEIYEPQVKTLRVKNLKKWDEALFSLGQILKHNP